MMKQNNLRLLIALTLILLTLFSVACGSPDASDGSEGPVGPVGPAGPASDVTDTDNHDHDYTTDEPSVNYAPDFEVMDKDGNTVKLSDFRGKPVVVNFWATWCPPCRAELPDFDEAAATYGDDVVFLMVNLTDGVRETVSGVKEFMSENGYTFPVYYDTTYSAANAYRVSSIPMTCFINAEGAVVKQNVGMISASVLEEGIGLILN